MRYDTERKPAKLPQVRITQRMDDEIRAACADLSRPVAWVVTEALIAWLNDYRTAPSHAIERSRDSS